MPDCTKVLPIALCRKLFRYEPETGKIIRLKSYPGKPVGSEAGAFQDDYIYVAYQGRRILAHRLAWAIHYGEWPMLPIDHINYNRHDNRIENLRLVTVAENNRNRPKQSNNTSGFKGVTRLRGGRYSAKIMANKERHHLGSFETAEEAFEAYCQAAARLHGEHARVSEHSTFAGASQ